MAKAPADTAMGSAKKGSADLLILALVEQQPLHGYEIARLIEMRSRGAIRFTLASLYETLYRLEERGRIRGRWIERAGQRRRRYYTITDAGAKMLAARREDWGRFIAALVEVAGVKPA
ncbi:MAG TPA: helix-turn-helix transcriptional regulator [Vicinamibacterales bacterium]|nr:helix-turn-helix transcriptional regulator [Vicinamibacterales bacterium]